LEVKNRIQLIKGDITLQKVDAMVNAANKTLLGGGGVDAAIHRAAGPKLLEECKTLGGCETGEAKITRAYNLPSKYVIHTVGPVWMWMGGLRSRGSHTRKGKNEAELLRKCYLNSLKLAEEKGLKTIAFPNISTGIYSYPKEEAARIAIETVREYLKSSIIEKVIFVCFNDENYEIYKKLFNS